MAKNQYSRKTEHRSGTDFEKLIQDLKFTTLDKASSLIDAMFDGADDFLFSLADKAENNREQQDYFDVMRLLRLERTQIKSEFLAHIQISLRPTVESEPLEPVSNTQVNDEELCLIDQDVMEEMVAISSMEEKITQLYRDTLGALRKRLQTLSELTALAFHFQAVEPKVFCQAFQTAVKPLNNELDLQTKLILYKLFDLSVMVNLDQIYETLNTQLTQANILAKETHSAVKRTSAADSDLSFSELENGLDEPVHSLNTAENMSVQGSPHYAPDHTVGEFQQDQAIYQAVSRYIHPHTPQATVQPTSTHTPGAHFSRDHLISGLSGLQKKQPYTKLFEATELKRALQKQISRGQSGMVSQQVSQPDSRVIELVQHVYNAILSHTETSPLAEAQLLKLQIPLFKAAFIDETLLTTTNHPVKQFINKLYENLALVEDKQDHAYAFFNELTDEIARDFDQDIGFFDTMMDKLNQWLVDLEEQIKHNEAAAQKQALKGVARQVVIKQLRTTLKQASFPPALHTLILKQWATLMYRGYTKYGKNSPQWTHLLALFDETVDSFQPLPAVYDEAEISQRYKKLRSRIEKLFIKSKQNEAHVKASIEALEITHEELIAEADRVDALDEIEDTGLDMTDGENLPAVDIAAEIDRVISPAAQSDHSASTWEETDVDAIEPLSKLPDYIQPGAWFEIKDNKMGTSRKLRLSAIIVDEGIMVFVDRNGLKAMEKTTTELLSDIDKKDCTHIENHSVFDKSLSLAISKLSAVG